MSKNTDLTNYICVVEKNNTKCCKKLQKELDQTGRWSFKRAEEQRVVTTGK